MVCVGKNIANCSENLQFLPLMCALCARTVPTRPPESSNVEVLCSNSPRSMVVSRSDAPRPAPRQKPHEKSGMRAMHLPINHMRLLVIVASVWGLASFGSGCLGNHVLWPLAKTLARHLCCAILCLAWRACAIPWEQGRGGGPAPPPGSGGTAARMRGGNKRFRGGGGGASGTMWGGGVQ